MRESGVQKSAWAAVSQLALRFVADVRIALFRVHTGKAIISGSGKPLWQSDGSVLVFGGRPIALGFSLINGDPVVGTPDLDGWTSVIVTPEMVGTRVAIFTAIETKESGGGKKREDQKKFLQRLNEDGGIAGFAKSDEEATALVIEYLAARNIA